MDFVWEDASVAACFFSGWRVRFCLVITPAVKEELVKWKPVVKLNFEFWSKETEILNFSFPRKLWSCISFFLLLLVLSYLFLFSEKIFLSFCEKLNFWIFFSPGKLKSGFVFSFVRTPEQQNTGTIFYFFVLLVCSVWLLRNCSIWLLRQCKNGKVFFPLFSFQILIQHEYIWFRIPPPSFLSKQMGVGRNFRVLRIVMLSGVLILNYSSKSYSRDCLSINFIRSLRDFYLLIFRIYWTDKKSPGLFHWQVWDDDSLSTSCNTLRVLKFLCFFPYVQFVCLENIGKG